ncbi:MAG: SPFH domain-containing protein [Spirochaetales bacterium]|nr:SPFH domain-containing protein [Spirochaetales bacterium]
MGLLAKISGQQQDLFKWDSQNSDVLLYRTDNGRQLIKKGALLHVADNQLAVISSKGVPADVFYTGTYTLDHESLPKLIKLQGLNQNHIGPFIADILFFNLTAFCDLKWKSMHPVPYKDPEYGKINIRLRGRGSFILNDPGLFLSGIGSYQHEILIHTAREKISAMIVRTVCRFLENRDICLTEMEEKIPEVESLAEQSLRYDFTQYGLTIQEIRITHISAPDTIRQISIDRSEAANTALQGKKVPPVPGQALYYTAENGEQKGPYKISELTGRFAKARITADTYVWTSGMTNWQKVSAIPSLYEKVRGES